MRRAFWGWTVAGSQERSQRRDLRSSLGDAGLGLQRSGWLCRERDSQDQGHREEQASMTGPRRGVEGVDP